MDRTALASRTIALALLACFALSTPSAAQDASGAPYPRPAGAHEVVARRAVGLEQLLPEPDVRAQE